MFLLPQNSPLPVVTLCVVKDPRMGSSEKAHLIQTPTSETRDHHRRALPSLHCRFESAARLLLTTSDAQLRALRITAASISWLLPLPQFVAPLCTATRSSPLFFGVECKTLQLHKTMRPPLQNAPHHQIWTRHHLQQIPQAALNASENLTQSWLLLRPSPLATPIIANRKARRRNTCIFDVTTSPRGTSAADHGLATARLTLLLLARRRPTATTTVANQVGCLNENAHCCSGFAAQAATECNCTNQKKKKLFSSLSHNFFWFLSLSLFILRCNG